MVDLMMKSMKGYVTTYRSVANKTAAELEKSLGFGSGALCAGYLLYQLSELVQVNEFEWKDKTCYSEGWHYDQTINEFVQRQDELRANFAAKNDWNEAVVDGKLLAFMKNQCLKLNMRVGDDRIVKIWPREKGDKYPDSPFRYVPQWKLTVTKQFSLVPQQT